MLGRASPGGGGASPQHSTKVPGQSMLASPSPTRGGGGGHRVQLGPISTRQLKVNRDLMMIPGSGPSSDSLLGTAPVHRSSPPTTGGIALSPNLRKANPHPTVVGEAAASQLRTPSPDSPTHPTMTTSGSTVLAGGSGSGGYEAFEAQLQHFLNLSVHRREGRLGLSLRWAELAHWVSKYQVDHDTTELADGATALLRELEDHSGTANSDGHPSPSAEGGAAATRSPSLMPGSTTTSSSGSTTPTSVQCAVLCTIMEHACNLLGRQWAPLRSILDRTFVELLSAIFLVSPIRSIDYSSSRAHDAQSMAADVTTFLGKTYCGRLKRVAKALTENEAQLVTTERIKAKQLEVMDKVVSHWQYYSVNRIFTAWRNEARKEKERLQLRSEMQARTMDEAARMQEQNEEISQLRITLAGVEEQLRNSVVVQSSMSKQLEESEQRIAELSSANERLESELEALKRGTGNGRRRSMIGGSRRSSRVLTPIPAMDSGEDNDGDGSISPSSPPASHHPGKKLAAGDCPRCRVAATKLTQATLAIQELQTSLDECMSIPLYPSPGISQEFNSSNKTAASICRAFLEQHNASTVPVSFLNGGATIAAYLNLLECRAAGIVPQSAVDDVRCMKNEDTQAAKFTVLLKTYLGLSKVDITTWTESDHISVLGKLLLRCQRIAQSPPTALEDLPLMLRQQREYIQVIEFLLDPSSSSGCSGSGGAVTNTSLSSTTSASFNLGRRAS